MTSSLTPGTVVVVHYTIDANAGDGRSGNRRQQGAAQRVLEVPAPAVRSRTGIGCQWGRVLGQVGADQHGVSSLLSTSRRRPVCGAQGQRPIAPQLIEGICSGAAPHGLLWYSTISCSVSGTSICARSGSWWIRTRAAPPPLAASSGARPPSPGQSGTAGTCPHVDIITVLRRGRLRAIDVHAVRR